MAAHSSGRVLESIRMSVSLEEEGEERGYFDIGRQVPDDEIHRCPIEQVEYLLTCWVVHRLEIDAPFVASLSASRAPQCRGVPLDNLADAMADGLQERVSRGESVRTRHKTTA